MNQNYQVQVKLNIRVSTNLQDKKDFWRIEETAKINRSDPWKSRKRKSLSQLSQQGDK